MQTSRFAHLIAFVQLLSSGGDPDTQTAADAAIKSIQAEDAKIEQTLSDHENRIAVLEGVLSALDSAAAGDTVLGGSSNDVITGSASNLDLSTLDTADTVLGAAGADTLSPTTGVDTVLAGGADTLSSAVANDMTASAAEDLSLLGSDSVAVAADTLAASAGNDTLLSALGVDTVQASDTVQQ
jgi:Ca2+-binding RTX toxin-like protein